MIGNFGENSLLVKTYKYLVNNSIMLGSSMIKPLYTKHTAQSLTDAYLINVSKTVSTEAIVFTVKNDDTYKTIKFKTLTFATDGNKSVKFALYKNGVTGGTFASWGGDSIATFGTTSTLAVTTTTVDGITKVEERVGGTILSKIDSLRIDLSDGDVEIDVKPGETLTFTAKSASSNEITVLARWIEEI